MSPDLKFGPNEFSPEEEPVDLSPLDPMQDSARWQSLLDRTLQRVDAVLAETSRRDGLLDLIASWRRPLAVGALAATLVIAVVELALEQRERRTERIHRLVLISSAWPPDHPPSSAEFLRALGGSRPPASEER